MIVITGILLALALPGLSRWIADTRLRNQAGYVISGLQLAKGGFFVIGLEARLAIGPGVAGARSFVLQGPAE